MMDIENVIISIVFSIILSQSASKQFLRVHDGNVDTNNDYPFVVALGSFQSKEEMAVLDISVSLDTNDSVFVKGCSGSLITVQWVLSAAHCIARNPTGRSVIRFWNESRVEYGKQLKGIRHPRYEYYTVHKGIARNDIGLLLIDKFPLHKYGRVSAVDYKTLLGLPVKYTGFGVTQKLPSYVKDQVSLIKFVTKHKTKKRKVGEAVVIPCDGELLSQASYSPIICMAPKCSRKTQMATHGDSGGPVFQGGRIVGVIINGDFQHSLVSATPVDPYIDWIHLVMSTHQS